MALSHYPCVSRHLTAVAAAAPQLQRLDAALAVNFSGLWRGARVVLPHLTELHLSGASFAGDSDEARALVSVAPALRVLHVSEYPFCHLSPVCDHPALEEIHEHAAFHYMASRRFDNHAAAWILMSLPRLHTLTLYSSNELRRLAAIGGQLHALTALTITSPDGSLTALSHIAAAAGATLRRLALHGCYMPPADAQDSQLHNSLCCLNRFVRLERLEVKFKMDRGARVKPEVYGAIFAPLALPTVCPPCLREVVVFAPGAWMFNGNTEWHAAWMRELRMLLARLPPGLLQLEAASEGESTM